MTAIEWIGYVAATLTTISFLPQAMQVFKTKDVSSISLGMYCIFTAGVLMWLIYGVLQQDWPIILANVITLVLAVSILVMKIKYSAK